MLKGNNRQQGCCVSVKKKKNLIAAPGCTDDDAAVAALPEKWIPRHAGAVLTNYLKSQEQNHENVLEDMSKAAASINEGIDSKVRVLAESLLSHIKQNELDMNCVVDQIGRQTTAPLTQEERRQALKRISELHSKRLEDMAAFRRDAMVLERQRADELRKLLRNQFQRLIKVGHRPPRELLHEFDQRTYEINQQLLSNSRAYAELEANLQAKADANLIRIKSDLNQMCLGISRSATSSQHEDKQYRMHSASASVKNREPSVPSIGHIFRDVKQFDECVAILVQAYKKAVLKVFSGFSGKFSDLHKQLGLIETDPSIAEVIDLQDMIERVLNKLTSSFQKNQPSNIELIDMTRYETLKMQKSLYCLGERLRDTYTILHDSGHLWDAHMFRSALAQKLTMACVEDLVTNNDTIELTNEVMFNVALEQLRSAPDVDKLQQQYEIIVAMLERTAEMYKQHGDAETGRLEEFMKFPEIMATILMSEFHCFLEKYPRISIQKSGNETSGQWGAASPRLEPKTFRMPIPRVILQTELQEMSLLNWRNGFLETFQNNVSLVPEELTNHARLWVDEKVRALRVRYSLKLVSHSIRLERIRAARDRRLAELKHHETRLDSHLEAVYDLVERLPTEASEFLALDTPELYPFCEWIDKIQANIDSLQAEDTIDPEVKRLKMCSYGPRLNKHRSLFENSLNLAMDACKRQIENRIQEARISNVRLASQLKLFSERGRYSAVEATRASASIMRGADAIESCITRSIDALNQRRKHLMDLADQRLAPLLRVVDEFTKSGGKGALDKRKPGVPAKKK